MTRAALGVACVAAMLVATMGACSRRRGTELVPTHGAATPSSISSPAVASAAAPSPAVVEVPAEEEETKAEPGRFERDTERAVPYVARLKAVLARNDREAFARSLTYPVRVNTKSLCRASIDSAEVFLTHFDAIVKGRVDQAIRNSRPPFSANYQGVMLDRGSVWMRVGDAGVRVSAFYSDAWRLPLPCAGEPEEAVPASLAGSWRVTSVAILQGGQLESRSPLGWLQRELDFDLERRRVRVKLEPAKPRTCAILRAARRDPDALRALGAPWTGLASEDCVFVDLECGNGRSRSVERVDIVDDATIALVGDDKYLLLLKRAPSPARPAKRLERDALCGDPAEVCPKPQICLATPVPGAPRRERCNDID